MNKERHHEEAVCRTCIVAEAESRGWGPKGKTTIHKIKYAVLLYGLYAVAVLPEVV